MESPRDEEAGNGASPPQRPRSSLSSLIIAILLIMLLTSHNSEEFLARHQYQDALQKLAYQLGNYTAWMNGTAAEFNITRNTYLMPLLHYLLPHNGTIDPRVSSYYPNITGFLHGEVKYHNLSQESLERSSFPWVPSARLYVDNTSINQTRNGSEVALKLGSWNWTAPEEIAISVVEKEPLYTYANHPISLIHGRIEFADNNTSEELKFDLEGIHFIDNGTIYAFAEPQGRSLDIRYLPAIVPDYLQNDTAHLIEPELTTRMEKLKYLIDAGIIEQEVSPTSEAPRTSCSFQLFAQLDSVNIPAILMQEYESEMQNPTGIRPVIPSTLSMKAILVSKECEIMYKINNVTSTRLKAFFRKITTYSGTAAVAYLAILVFLTRQMTRSSTPTGLSRVSRWTFLTQTTIDALSFAGHITFAILTEGRPSISLIAPGFIACITFIYEAQFAMLIHQIQIPEDAVAVQPRPPPTMPTPTSSAQNATPTANTDPVSISPPASNRAEENIAPQTATQPTLPQTQSTSFWGFVWQQIRTDPQARLWVILFVFLTTFVRIFLSPTLTLLFVAITYSMIWVPQIIRSVRRGRNSGLSKEYIIGTSVARLFLLLYFLTCPKNVLEIKRRAWAYPLTGFVCLQASVLILQEIFGPSFFLPKKFATVKTYDYHPHMPLPDPEAPEQTLGDCAICMDAIHIDPSLRNRTQEKDADPGWDVKASGALTGSTKRKATRSTNVMGAGGLLDAVQKGVGSAVNRQYYSLAPCHHLFHTACLERWLAIKNICPQCRRPLPAL
ncbi:hypothetical protein E1B28_007171 [Marasmius oreades]|uniref:RING-type E3 ubiquitin transferase n=1 Tax=Marasmius oreades TaxID=181124 RepID=A0A9P7S1C1_9AGAR|nr:uncharacterized protein E1B28_007171 [Marasmius oreades]KAG7093495.1 hypothetical protein E1B28_007171 [Marasmius oreades]